MWHQLNDVLMSAAVGCVAVTLLMQVLTLRSYQRMNRELIETLKKESAVRHHIERVMAQLKAVPGHTVKVIAPPDEGREGLLVGYTDDGWAKVWLFEGQPRIFDRRAVIGTNVDIRPFDERFAGSSPDEA